MDATGFEGNSGGDYYNFLGILKTNCWFDTETLRLDWDRQLEYFNTRG